MNKKIVIIIVCVLVVVVGCWFLFNDKKEEPKVVVHDYEVINKDYYSYNYVNSYQEYMDLFLENESYLFTKELTENDFNKKQYLVVLINTDQCSERIEKDELKIENNTYKVYFDVAYGCGVCAPSKSVYIYEVSDILEVSVLSKEISRSTCDPNIAYKPIIYIYPEEDIDLTIKLGNTNNLTFTYPKYNDSWNVRVSTDGNIYDYDTNRNYYGLYWEAYDYYKLDMNKGFVVRGEDTVKFLEEKLEILGLNEREINEFIIYWIDKIENNKYNFISFRSIDDINKTMPLEFSKNPDTLIRVMVDFKKLDNYIEVEEQQLTKVERNGYTVVEWGGTIHK